MKNYNQNKELVFTKLSGISDKSIENHYTLYQGYVKKWQEIQNKLTTTDFSLANATFSDIRELKVEESFAANAIILHEAYFDILGGDGQPIGELMAALEKTFGSFENWLNQFKLLGLSSRGWVILAFDYNDGQLKNYIADTHNSFGVWGTSPILVLDMYEHAYFSDFGTDKKTYIEVFFKNLNWSKINKRYENRIK